MKFDNVRFDIPKQTNRNSPLIQSFTLWLPVIQSVKVKIPKGHKGLAVLNIDAAGYQIMSNIYGDDETKESGALDVRLFGPPYMVILSGWNDDIYLAHEFMIEISTREDKQ